MSKKITITLATVGLAVLGAFALAGEDPAQHNSNHSETFFFSGGRSYLGVDIRDISTDRVGPLKLKEERGVEVTMVDQDAPAGKAGLKEHDVILEYNGAKVESEQQLRRMISETPPGRTVALGISRDGNPMSIKVELGDRSKIVADNRIQIMVPQPPEPPEMNIPFIISPTYTPALGIQADAVGRQLGDYFGVKNGEGLLIKSVEKGSAGEKAGLKAGDVIVKADSEKVTDRSDLRRVLRNHRQGGKVTLGIIRDKHEQSVTVDVPARKSGDSSELEFDFHGLEGLADLADLGDMDFDVIDEIPSDIEIDLPDLENLKELKELGPKIQRQIQQNLQNLKGTLPKMVEAQVLKIGPEVRKSLEGLKPQMDQLREQLKDFHIDLQQECKSRFI